jgi:glycosyltransferase involved in cell wall biosynthesis
MKVALVTHNVVRGDGQGRVCFELVRHALQAGVEVEMFADQVDEALVKAGARWTSVKPAAVPTNLYKVWDFARRADRALALRHGDFDIIHAHGHVLNTPHHVNTAHMIHAAWRNAPGYADACGRGWRGLYRRAYTNLNSRWERQTYGRASVVVAVSERVRADLRALGLPKAKVRVIHHGVDPAEYCPGSINRQALGIPAAGPLILFAGNLRTDLKNAGTLLKAMVQVPGASLALAGSVERSPFPALAARLGLTARIHFLGYRNDLPDLMRAADVFVLPSRYESFSLVLLEAMASGLPVVTARTVGAAELVSHACGIVLDDPNDESALGRALLALVNDEALRKRMGLAARQTAALHSWQRMAREYLQLYEEARR